ncbi:kinase-like protein [Clavulina sp. PMI_390]|nr:kinase-like protein [Clavulina sp. PMI_390]
METRVQSNDLSPPGSQGEGDDAQVVSLAASLIDSEDISLLDEALMGDKMGTEEQQKRPSQSYTGVYKRHDRSSENSLAAASNDEIWGQLYPFTLDLPVFMCRKSQSVYLVGRGVNCDFIIPNSQVSTEHCSISYDPELDVVQIKDHSNNGTSVNGRPIGKGNIVAITGSPEISFGRPGHKGSDGIRFIFRHSSDEDYKVLGGGLYQEYEQLEVLGEGSLGVVRKLRHQKTGRLAAAKILFKTRYLDSQEGFSAEREVNIMMKLRHPNIVGFIDHYQDNGSFSRVSLDGARVKEITRLVCQGLAYIHSQAVTHRDLKPENILLTRDGIPKVADFGLAKMVVGQNFLKTSCGTPDYVAPEVLDDLPTGYSSKVDSWSMAVIVYGMLTGRNSHHGHFRHRVYDSKGLLKFNVSEEETDPNVRLSMEEALQHPWLITDDFNP